MEKTKKLEIVKNKRTAKPSQTFEDLEKKKKLFYGDALEGSKALTTAPEKGKIKRLSPNASSSKVGMDVKSLPLTQTEKKALELEMLRGFKEIKATFDAKMKKMPQIKGQVQTSPKIENINDDFDPLFSGVDVFGTIGIENTQSNFEELKELTIEVEIA